MANILNLQVGDSLVERSPGGKRILIPVTHVVFNACSKKGVHVNRNACYDNTAVVEIEYGSEVQDEEQEMNDLDNEIAELSNISPEAWADIVVKA